MDIGSWDSGVRILVVNVVGILVLRVSGPPE